MGEPLGQWTRTSAGGSGMRRTSRLMPKTWKGIGFMVSSYHTCAGANGGGHRHSPTPGRARWEPGLSIPSSFASTRLRAAPAVVGLLEKALEVLQGKLGVHGHQAISDAHHGVHPIARRELVLEDVVLLREHLGEHVLEERLSQSAPDLGRLEDLLETGNA